MRALIGLLTCAAASVAVAEKNEPLPLRLKVLTFNIAGGAGNAHGFKQPMDVERVAEIIRSSGADVVALQEVDKNVGRNGNPSRDTSGVLAEKAGYPFVFFGKAIPLRGGEYGNALLSRTVPVSVRRVALPGTGEARVFIDARYRMADGQTLAVCATHFCHQGSANRMAQAEAILAYYKANPADRVIVTGDLNADHTSPELTRFAETFDCLTPEPDKATYIAGGSAIDHVFTYPKGAWRLAEGGASGRRYYPENTPPASDHWPVLGELEVISTAASE